MLHLLNAPIVKAHLLTERFSLNRAKRLGLVVPRFDYEFVHNYGKQLKIRIVDSEARALKLMIRTSVSFRVVAIKPRRRWVERQ